MSEAKLTVIYDSPTDPEAFETAYVAEQLEAARKIPGYLRLEASKVWPKEDGMPTAVTTTLAVEREFARLDYEADRTPGSGYEPNVAGGEHRPRARR